MTTTLTCLGCWLVAVCDMKKTRDGGQRRLLLFDRRRGRGLWVSLVLIVDVLGWNVGGKVRWSRSNVRPLVLLVLLVIVVRLLEWLLRLVLVVMIARLTFPPAAVYHTSQMHSHGRDVCLCDGRRVG